MFCIHVVHVLRAVYVMNVCVMRGMCEVSVETNGFLDSEYAKLYVCVRVYMHVRMYMDVHVPAVTTAS